MIRGGKTFSSVWTDFRTLFQAAFDTFLCLCQPCVALARRMKSRREKYSPLSTVKSNCARITLDTGEDEEVKEDLVSPEVVTSGARRADKEPANLDRRPAMLNKVQEQELIPLSTAASEMPD